MLIKDPQVAAKIARWRQLDAEGKLTLDDMREIVTVARQGRTNASEASRTSKSRTGGKKPVQSTEEMMNEIDSL